MKTYRHTGVNPIHLPVEPREDSPVQIFYPGSRFTLQLPEALEKFLIEIEAIAIIKEEPVVAPVERKKKPEPIKTEEKAAE